MEIALLPFAPLPSFEGGEAPNEALAILTMRRGIAVRAAPAFLARTNRDQDIQTGRHPRSSSDLPDGQLS